VVYDALRVRVSSHIAAQERVSALRITSCPMDSMGLTLGSVFAPPPEDDGENETNTGTSTVGGGGGGGGGDGGELVSDLAAKLDSLRGEVFNDHLRYLCVYDTFVDRFDTSLNRFRRLTTLDLSGNRIATLHGNLDLPQVILV
jgi:hypothetical protein